MKRICSLLAALIAAGCQSEYALTVNEQVVYTPPPLLSAFKLADAALDACVRQHIADQRVRAPGDLKRLSCTHAGIGSVAGLEMFSGLEALNLDDNRIADTTPLARLDALTTLSLARNTLTTVAPLRALTGLESLQVAGNDRLDCGSLRDWPASTRIEPPAHCGG